MICFDSDICTNFEAASSREWLETNGIGGFASGTISGAGTRRYHGLLIAATRAPLGRILTLSKLEETLIIDGRRYNLSSNQFPGTIHPDGYKYLKNFRLDPFPIWTYEIEGLKLEKKLFMVHGENTTVVQWHLENAGIGERPQLEIRPLLAFRDYHHLQKKNFDFQPSCSISPGIISLKPYSNLPELIFTHNATDAASTGVWHENFEYAIEKERGFDFREDLFQPFVLQFDLAQPAAILVSTDCRSPHEVRAKFVGPNDFALTSCGLLQDLETDEIFRREELIERAKAKNDFTRQLTLAADQFIVRRGAGHTIIAGYPWFSDWGRDTMIALNGLTLATNRAEIAREILLEYSRHISEGMIPNRFPDEGEQPEYNTVDATLWYFEAIRAYVEKTGDYKFLRKHLYEKLAHIVAAHIRGTRFNIRVDADGLLYAGSQETQLTWMDAKIGDLVVTPRVGKPVEIEALWYNALKIMSDFAQKFRDRKDMQRYDEMAELAKQSFNAVFWNEDEQCLFDVVSNDRRDAAIRPNQIFAVSLSHSMLDIERSRKVLKKVETELLTPFGLRSLSPRDINYVPVYEGSPSARDSAYHQGTVWAWLIGPFGDAYRKVHGHNDATKARLGEILSAFESHVREAGIGQISEIFDADPPHLPRGCFAQAWSVAEVLRARVSLP